ncbi:MAG: hypothetical protein L0191_18630, partial [Acidobacteria bacterium]|nr:hypothetical protein [Acidobacteriota bacterium]
MRPITACAIVLSCCVNVVPAPAQQGPSTPTESARPANIIPGGELRPRAVLVVRHERQRGRRLEGQVEQLALLRVEGGRRGGGPRGLAAAGRLLGSGRRSGCRTDGHEQGADEVDERHAGVSAP